MAINAHHPFEELDGIKCSVVEKNCTQSRVDFLKELLEFNRYSVVVCKSPPPKAAAKVVTAVADQVPPPEVVVSSLPETFSVGVTDLLFNSTNAIFGRLLHTKDGHVVTLSYWQQQELVSHDEIPYFQKKK